MHISDCVITEELFYLCFHCRLHLDERRPGAFETFAGEFLRRVAAQLAALPREIVLP